MTPTDYAIVHHSEFPDFFTVNCFENDELFTLISTVVCSY